MLKIKLLLLILILLIPINASAAVTYVAHNEYTTDNGESIQMTIPTGWSVGDCLIAYISKDDDIVVDDLAGWTTLVSQTAGTGNALYIAYRVAETGDTNWTWLSTGDTGEDWLGEIICYTGTAAAPIHDSGFTVQAVADANPIAPSVGFTALTAGSLVFQCFGQDTDDTPYTIPAQLIPAIFNTGFGDTGGAGGDRECAGGWVSPTGHGGTGWTNEDYTYDENIVSGAYNQTAATTWSDYLELTHSAISCDKVMTNCYYWNGTNGGTQISVDVYYSSGWHNLFEGDFEAYDRKWQEHSVGSTQTVTAMRIKVYNGQTAARYLYINEADFYDVETTTGNTGTAEFTITGTDTWVAATVIIEAEAEEEPEAGTNVLFTFSAF